MDTVLQELANGIATGAYVAILSIGYALIAGTTREFHFAHGGVFMIAAWILVLTTTAGWWFGVAFIACLVVAATVGVAIERFFYGPLRRRSDSSVAVILTGLALYIVLENVVVMLAGSQLRYPANPIPGTLRLGNVILTRVELLGIALLPVLFVAMMLLLTKTGLGRSIRAVGSDPELAYTVGVDADVVRTKVFAIGSCLAAFAALVLSLDAGFIPPMGLQAILLATIAVTAGGFGSLPGAAVAGLLLGMAQHVSFLGIGSEWQNPIAFGVLMVLVLSRPQGIGARTA